MNKILVVDDQNDTLEEVTSMLERKGIVVVSAQSTKSAASLFFESVSSILAILIDIKLNDPTTADRAGYELACRLRGYNRFIPIFLYSAYPIDDDIKSDNRLSGWFQKGGSPKDRINIEKIQVAGQSYWDDFHRDDPKDLLKIKERLGIDEQDFLKLVEPKTPLRHEKIIDLVFDSDVDQFSLDTQDDSHDWKLTKLQRRKVAFRDADGNSMSLTGRVSVLEKPEEGIKCMLSSLPFVFAYGEDVDAAMANLTRTIADLFNIVHGIGNKKEKLSESIDGADYLRLRSFLNRVTEN